MLSIAPTSYDCVVSVEWEIGMQRHTVYVEEVEQPDDY
jgi:hypothetical protein